MLILTCFAVYPSQSDNNPARQASRQVFLTCNSCTCLACDASLYKESLPLHTNQYLACRSHLCCSNRFSPSGAKEELDRCLSLSNAESSNEEDSDSEADSLRSGILSGTFENLSTNIGTAVTCR